jgi:hypothetical protein
MVNSIDLLTHKLMSVNFQEVENQNNSPGETGQNQDGFRAIKIQLTLSRELKKKIRQNICDWTYVENIINTLSPQALVELETFLWDEAIQYGESVLQQKLTREYITGRMESTPNYHHKQGCNEPLIACRANYCIHSNPNCASFKIKQHIKAIAGVFDRRTLTMRDAKESLDNYFRHFIEKYGLVSMILTTSTGVPVAAVSEFDSQTLSHYDHSDFVKSFFLHLNQYIDASTTSGSVTFDINLKAITQKIEIKAQKLIVTLLSVKEESLDVSLFQAVIGIDRILSGVVELAS